MDGVFSTQIQQHKKPIAVVETNSGYENKIICTIRINTYLVGWLVVDSVNRLNEHYSVCAEVRLTNNVGFSPYRCYTSSSICQLSAYSARWIHAGMRRLRLADDSCKSRNLIKNLHHESMILLLSH
jgi:hypothetical protein